MSKNVLITGGLGFIGNNLIRKLLQTTDYSFLTLDKTVTKIKLKNLPQDKDSQKRISVIQGDITNQKDVIKALKRADIVIHLAADTHVFGSLIHPSSTVITNVIGTVNILEAIEKYPVEKFIMFSSSEVYGSQIKDQTMDEFHLLQPVTPYGVSKLAADRLAYSFFLTKKVPVVILRPFNVYGTYQAPNKMIPRFITELLKGNIITLNHSGKTLRDWIHVEDIANAVDIVLKAPIEQINGEAFNIGTGKVTSTKDVAYLIADNLGKDRSMIHFSQNSQPETMSNVGISKKAKRLLGWQAKITLEEGIKKNIDWYKNNRAWWSRKS